ncbi:hypothetical protein U8527_21615 [Kordia algicida OT-1]|uniref:RING-type E3 ubiquitin transferase n=1 Tax=Kordia algicida OT-1 TaxID=391587 RepID=A9DQ47_9FLAO|nr:hypothetical protein [Kordia algicida]EDP96571.1 hypothetical protein KAOT1_15448 [Kordia algicida OT-1]
MDYFEFIIPALFVLGVGAFIFVAIYFSIKNKILRELKKVRRKNIQSVRENEYVKIVGKAKYAGEPLIAPLSKRKCVYYDVKVKEKRGKHWRNIINDVQFQDFFIQTGTDSAIIHLNTRRGFEKRVHLVADHAFSSGFLNTVDEEVERYLGQYGKNSKGAFGFNRTMRYTERIIEVDEEIAVMGIGKWSTIDTPIDGYSDSRILTLSGNSKQRLLITDEPKALERVKRKL